MNAPMQLTFTKDLARQFTDELKNDFSGMERRFKQARDGKIWEPLGYSSWDEYCVKEFNYSKRHANRIIEFAEIKEVVGPMVPTPTSERQVRPLAHLPPEEQKEVWKKAVEIGGGKPTAKQVQAAVEIVVEQPKQEAAKFAPIKIELDNGMEMWARAKTILDQISKTDKSRVKALESCLDYAQKRLHDNK